MRMKHNKIYKDGKYVPLRTCVACRMVKPKAELLRVTSFEGEVSLDKKGNASGIGVYVCNNIVCIEKAQKIRGLERGLGANVPAYIYEECINIDKE